MRIIVTFIHKECEDFEKSQNWKKCSNKKKKCRAGTEDLLHLELGKMIEVVGTGGARYYLFLLAGNKGGRSTSKIQKFR